jgi:predicted nucleic acid-binding protein
MIVVDTNVIGYLYLTGEWTRQAEEALQRDAHWTAPLLWRSEMRSVLVSYIRKGILQLEDAERIMNEATVLMSGGEYEIISSEVLRLASGSKCSAYDCEFVALAQDLRASLVTVDKQVLGEFSEIAVSLQEFVEG